MRGRRTGSAVSRRWRTLTVTALASAAMRQDLFNALFYLLACGCDAAQFDAVLAKMAAVAQTAPSALYAAHTEALLDTILVRLRQPPVGWLPTPELTPAQPNPVP